MQNSKHSRSRYDDLTPQVLGEQKKKITCLIKRQSEKFQNEHGCRQKGKGLGDFNRGETSPVEDTLEKEKKR